MGLGPAPLPILVFVFCCFGFFADGVGRQLLSFLGMAAREMGKGGVFDGFHILQRAAWLEGR